MANKKHRYAGQRLRELKTPDIVDRIQRNGITLADLRKNHQLGYEQGKADGLSWGYDAAYGSMMLALHREFGFGRERLSRLAMATAEIQINCTVNREAYEQLVAETGLSLPEMREIVDSGGI